MGNALQHAALVFAVPTRTTDLEDMLAGRILPDYRGVFDDDDDHDRIRTCLAPGIAEAERLIDLAAAEGAAIFERAVLGDLASASADRELLIYFGHARGALLQAEDIVDFAGWEARLRSASPPAAFDPLAACISAEQAAREMSSLIVQGALLPLLPPQARDALAGNQAMVRTVGRDLIDEFFAGTIRPGNQMEMFDGLHAPGRFVDAISPEFAGELDLTMCHSIAAAALLDIRRGDRIRHVHWDGSVTPRAQFLLVAETLRRLLAGGDSTPPEKPPSYIAIRMDLHRALLERG